MRAKLEWQQSPAPDELLSIREVAVRLKRKVATVEAMVDSGELPHVWRCAALIPAVCLRRYLPD